jgi:hypothetical protein
MLLPDQAFPPDYRLLFARRIEMLTEMRGSLRRMQQFLLYYKHNPVDFICDWVSRLIPAMPVCPAHISLINGLRAARETSNRHRSATTMADGQCLSGSRCAWSCSAARRIFSASST